MRWLKLGREAAYSSGSEIVAPSPAASVSPGNLSQNTDSQAYSRPTELETLETGPSNLDVNEPSG